MSKIVLRDGLRTFIRQRLYSSINITGLTIGLLSFMLITLYVRDERSFDRFHNQSKRIYRLYDDIDGRAGAIVPYVWGESLKNEIPEIENYTTFQNITIGLTVKKDDKVYAQYNMLAADSAFFEIFDFPVARGDKTEFLKDPRKIILTPQAARKYFGKEDPMGQSLEVNLWGNFVTYQVGGLVACPSNSHIQFEFILPNHLVKRHFFDPSAYESWTTHFAYTYLLMPPDFDRNKLRNDLKEFLFRHGGEDLRDKFIPDVEPLESIYLKSDLAFDFPPRGNIAHTYILELVALGVLLMAIINFVNITTAQSLRRGKEVGIKKILGSRKGLLIAQFIIESTLVSLISAALCLILLSIILPYYNDYTGKTFVLNDLMSLSNLLMLLGLTVIVGVGSGLYPALLLSSFPPASILNHRPSGGSQGVLARKILVVIQFSLAAILIIATGIIYEQVNYMQQKDLGFNKDRVIIMKNSRTVASDIKKTRLLKEELTKYDQIQMVSASSTSPGQQSWTERYFAQGFEAEEGHSLPTIYVDHDFVETFDIRIIEGRDFDQKISTDTTALLISEATARLFSNEDPSWKSQPLNKKLKWSHQTKSGKVIGIFNDFHIRSLRYEIEPLVLQINPKNFFAIQVQINTEEVAGTLGLIKETWQRLFPEVPFNYRFVDEEFALHFQTDQKLVKLLTLFSLLSISVAILGIFGLASFLVFEKVREISIRKVVGATESQIVLLLSWTFLKLVLIANLIALPLSYSIMDSWLEEFAYRTAMPVYIFGLAATATLVVTLLTVLYHVIKTAGTNPTVVLNQQ